MWECALWLVGIETVHNRFQCICILSTHTPQYFSSINLCICTAIGTPRAHERCKCNAPCQVICTIHSHDQALWAFNTEFEQFRIQNSEEGPVYEQIHLELLSSRNCNRGGTFSSVSCFVCCRGKSQGAIKTPVAVVHGGTGGNYRKCMSYFVHWVGQQSCLSVKSGRMVFCHVCCNLHTCMLVYVKRFEPGIWNMALYNFHHQVFLLTPFSTICFSSVQDVAVQRGRHYFLGNNQFVHKLLSLKWLFVERANWWFSCKLAIEKRKTDAE